ncbi:hypothetical protein CHL79_25995 [Delftia acidovorans]|uniref:HNH endonuclease signature motif containing protein n=1 Tax=Delftia acidovorans TaxID=80866 RepID=UPI000BC32BEB|nr:HNH endonuclease signature motif containing protein [Delftia acidovorans]ATH15624.1 hypothetical protein CHL79_25995 [Delftia acidovorans]
MNTHNIVIHWDSAQEYVQIDIHEILAGAQITTTSEWWPNERRMVTYNTTSEVRRIPGGLVEITLSYDHSRNNHIDFEEACWGKSVIHLQETESNGIATWYDIDDKDRNGDASWNRLASGLFKEEKREYYSRLQREQDIFRVTLLAFDRCCVISKETMTTTLEAAHIIPSKMRGAEVVENGIILRADIHRLYDSGCFVIDPSGKVIVVREVSKYYGSILTEVQLPEQTVRRVSAALAHQWDVAAQQIAAADRHPATRAAGG